MSVLVVLAPWRLLLHVYESVCFISVSIKRIFQEICPELLCPVLVQNSIDLQVISKVNIVKTIKHTKDVPVSVFEIC